jgi:hypothetical protein
MVLPVHAVTVSYFLPHQVTQAITNHLQIKAVVGTTYALHSPPSAQPPANITHLTVQDRYQTVQDRYHMSQDLSVFQ